ncbi:glycosyl transferase, partial [Gautieria morchelliformis]
TRRLIVVSNRLPVTISQDVHGEYHFKMSSGGLVSALSGCKKPIMSFTWIGWPGFFIPERNRPLVDKHLLEEHSCQAVYLTDVVADRHYNGFSNSILWHILHYVGLHPSEVQCEEKFWLCKSLRNTRFAQLIRSQLHDGDTLWVQDYHLMLLPDLAAAPSVSNVKVGFFLHTPLPSSEIYRILPIRREILLVILYCDLIGFHTYDSLGAC